MYTYNTTQTVFLHTALHSLLLKSWIQLFHSVLCHAILRKLRPHKSPFEQFLLSPPSNWGATLTPWTPCLPSSALYFSIHHAPEKTRQRLPLCCVASGLAWFYDVTWWLVLPSPVHIVQYQWNTKYPMFVLFFLYITFCYIIYVVLFDLMPSKWCLFTFGFI